MVAAYSPAVLLAASPRVARDILLYAQPSILAEALVPIARRPDTPCEAVPPPPCGPRREGPTSNSEQRPMYLGHAALPPGTPPCA